MSLTYTTPVHCSRYFIMPLLVLCAVFEQVIVAHLSRPNDVPISSLNILFLTLMINAQCVPMKIMCTGVKKECLKKCIMVSQKFKKKLRIVNMEQGFTMELGFSISYRSFPDALITVPTDGWLESGLCRQCVLLGLVGSAYRLVFVHWLAGTSLYMMTR